ncbi:phosphoribosylaminoimidazole carboxylase (NCAIR synthetase) [Cenarchaeum symbiosum A]|uniref:N5-carboxyaminoimidazole ribonucleotide synthase n=1 Tax=Cenarchaeum symbiosum (strain A) TaxID=414004 RepID=A0RVW3_CENSY|nr:phosphoribosylaminoimidazole carboxylase (NCAIR synthetase) [Cenarchaeum symbiosum A]
MASTLGIIGGGQLGMMLTEAARGMPEHISEVIVLDPSPGCPASQAGAKQIAAGYADGSAIRELASRADVITYEIESGDADALESVLDITEVRPPPETLRMIQDKYVQKSFLKENKIPVGDFAPAGTIDELKEGLERFGRPALLKARRGAYDGRGNRVIQKGDDAAAALEQMGAPAYLEKMINYTMEVSVMAARSTSGEIRTYHPVENKHKDGILHMSIAPARIDENTARAAGQAARDVLDRIGGAGVFGIEMFVEKRGGILVNEVAPRVHNSGHHTLQSCITSQFEQHLRAVLGLELGDTKLLRPAVMCNILGPPGFEGRYKPVAAPEGIHLKMYGKESSRPGRKMGHYTVTGSWDQDVERLVDEARLAGETIRLAPT